MRTGSPELLPLFRSAGQARLLARIFLQPDRSATLAELARELDLDDGGLTRETNRLERAGLVQSARVGRSRIVHPNLESPYYPELYGLLLKAFGPATVVGPAFSVVPGVERAFVYGSWAARYLEMPGHDPVDVDVLVVGSPSRLAVARAARELTASLGREVNVVVVPRDEWDVGASGFLREVKNGPLVELDVRRESSDE